MKGASRRAVADTRRNRAKSNGYSRNLCWSRLVRSPECPDFPKAERPSEISTKSLCNTTARTARLNGKIKSILRTFLSDMIHDSAEATLINNTMRRSRFMVGDALNGIATNVDARALFIPRRLVAKLFHQRRSYRSVVKARGKRIASLDAQPEITQARMISDGALVLALIYLNWKKKRGTVVKYVAQFSRARRDTSLRVILILRPLQNVSNRSSINENIFPT